MFQVDESPFTAPDLLSWKYFDPHPSWPGTRSYLLQTDSGIVANAGMAPVRFVIGGQTVSSAQMIDWAAAAKTTGAGLTAFTECLPLADTILAIGGSSDARRIFPRLKWLRKLAHLRQYARPLRPFKQVLNSPLNVKSPARLARNLAWSIHPRLPSGHGWTCRRVTNFDHAWQPQSDIPVIERTADWLNYLLRCPGAELEGYVLLDNAQPAGHFLLARVGPQARLVDLAVRSVMQADWVSAISVATREAATNSATFEIAAASSLPDFCTALETCGFRPRGLVPVYVADGRGKFGGASLIEITLAIGDAFYAASPEWSCWT